MLELISSIFEMKTVSVPLLYLRTFSVLWTKTALMFALLLFSSTASSVFVSPNRKLWAGFFFTLIVTNLVSWPLGFYMRQLPVLNKMF